MLNSDAMYGITEMKNNWVVSVKRYHQRLIKGFAFSLHGGRDAALSAAQAWRDITILNHPAMLKREMATVMKRNNTTGYPGVFCVRRGDGSIASWVAKTNLGQGGIARKSFSVANLGKQAKLLAIAERAQQLELMEGRVRRTPVMGFALAPDGRVLQSAGVPGPALLAGELVRHNNSSGMSGVTLSRRPDGTPRAWLAATQFSPGDRVVEGFSCREHGERFARELAMAERQNQLDHKKRQLASGVLVPSSSHEPRRL